MRKTCILSSLLILWAILVGCHSNLPFECDPPCWVGLIPGETTKQEAQEMLYQQYGSEHVYWETIDRLIWDSRTNSEDVSGWGYISFNENEVSEIIVTGINELRAQTVISEIGTPDFVRITYDINLGCWNSILFYENINTVINLAGFGVENVSRNQLVQSITFESPDRMQELVSDTGSHSYDVEWNGYQDYCILE